MAAWITGVNIALATECHVLLPARRAVVGMAGAYTLSYVPGLALTNRQTLTEGVLAPSAAARRERARRAAAGRITPP